MPTQSATKLGISLLLLLVMVGPGGVGGAGWVGPGEQGVGLSGCPARGGGFLNFWPVFFSSLGEAPRNFLTQN